MGALGVTAAEPVSAVHSGVRPRVPDPVRLGLALGGLFLWLALQRDFGEDGYFVPLKGLVVVALGLAPGLAYLARVRRDPAGADPLPYLPVLGAIYALYYGLPVLVRDPLTFMSLSPGTAAVDRALDLAIVGWVALLAGYRVVAPRVFSARAARPLVVPWDPKRARSAALAFIGLGLVAQVAVETVEVPAYLGQVVRLVVVLQRVGLGILIVSQLRSGARDWRGLVLWLVVVPLYLLYFLRSGHVGAVVRPLAFLVFLVWACRFRLPWLTLGALALGIVLLRGAAEEFRTMSRGSSRMAEMPPLERAGAYLEIVQRDLTVRPAETLERSFDLIAARTAQLGLLAHTVHLTPQAVPYWGGETYKTLASSFVPRFVWRDKPTKTLGQRFGHRYAVLEPRDRTTSVNLPQLVELFANFGPLGVSAGMLLFGVLYAFAAFKLGRAGAGDGTLLIGAVVFSELVNIESDFSLVFGGLLQIAVALYVALRVCAPAATRAPVPLRGPRALGENA